MLCIRNMQCDDHERRHTVICDVLSNQIFLWRREFRIAVLSDATSVRGSFLTCDLFIQEQ
jgi:hypothetical protein